jgi:hypothetical protein
MTFETDSKDSDGDSVYLDSSRAGGQYSVTGTAVESIKKLSGKERALLTTWLCNQRRAGVECPKITSDIVDDVKSMRSLSTRERVERVLWYFNKRVRVGEVITTYVGDFLPEDRDSAPLAAFSECETNLELEGLMRLIVEMGWLDSPGGSLAASKFTPTAGGWLKIDDLVTRLPMSSQAFVAMWFHPLMDAAYKDGVEPAIRESGYLPVRIDNKEHINKIDDEIIAEIRRSKFLVADFTCEREKIRGGVYFEAGFAMALPIPVIWTRSDASIDDLHFDTRQYNHIVWDSPQTLHKLLRTRIGAVIGDGPLKVR